MVIVIYHQYGSLLLQAQVVFETVPAFGLILYCTRLGEHLCYFCDIINSMKWTTYANPNDIPSEELARRGKAFKQAEDEVFGGTGLVGNGSGNGDAMSSAQQNRVTERAQALMGFDIDLVEGDDPFPIDEGRIKTKPFELVSNKMHKSPKEVSPTTPIYTNRSELQPYEVDMENALNTRASFFTGFFGAGRKK